MRRAGYRFLRKVRAALPKTATRSDGREAVSARMLRWSRDRLVPKSRIWVRVEEGLAEGLWMRVQLPEETFLWRGDHEPDVQAVLAKLAQPGWVTYDVGSYVGFFALAMARAGGPAGRVVAFEPDPESAARLREHVARNQMDNYIQVVEAAAWHKSADKIPYRRGAQARSQGGVVADGMNPVLAAGEQILVRSISLDEFIADGNPAPQLIKVDVEGGEALILAGAENLIIRGKPLIICEVHHQAAALWLEQWLPERGYCLEWTIPPEGFPRRLVAQPAPSTN